MTQLDLPKRSAPSLTERILRSSPRRSLLILAGGTTAGLLIAGASLFSARGTTFGFVPPEAVALVNDKPILLSDYIAQFQTEYGLYATSTPAQRRKVLDDMISEELMVQRGVELDLPGTNGDVRAALVNAVELQVDANVLAARPSEDDLRAYYIAHRERYRTNGLISADELWISNAHPTQADKERARSAAGALKAGAGVAQVAQRFGMQTLNRLSTDTYDLTAKLRVGNTVYAAIETLRPGDVVGPIAIQDGLHVLRIRARTPPMLPPFESAMQTVYSDFLRDAKAPVDLANRQYLRRKAKVLFAPGFRE